MGGSRGKNGRRKIGKELMLRKWREGETRKTENAMGGLREERS